MARIDTARTPSASTHYASDRADIAREALEDVKVKLGALLARTPIAAQPDEMVDAYGVTLRALRRLDTPLGTPACPIILTHGRAA